MSKAYSAFQNIFELPHLNLTSWDYPAQFFTSVIPGAEVLLHCRIAAYFQAPAGLVLILQDKPFKSGKNIHIGISLESVMGWIFQDSSGEMTALEKK